MENVDNTDKRIAEVSKAISEGEVPAIVEQMADIVATQNIEKSSDDELVTQAQIAERLDLSISEVCKRIAEYGMSPVQDKVNLGRGKGWQPALYSAAQFSILQQQQQQQKIEIEKQKALERAVNNIKPEVRTEAVKVTLEDIMAEGDIKSMIGISAMMIQGLAKIAETADDLIERNKQLQLEVDEFKKQLDISTSVATPETYALNHGFSITRQKAGGITRKLHRMGYVDEGKISSKFDPNLPATVWKMEHLDVAYSMGLFFSKEKKEK